MADNNILKALESTLGLKVSEDLAYGDFKVRVRDGTTMNIPREYIEDYPDAVRNAILGQHYAVTDPMRAGAYMTNAAQHMGMSAQDVSKIFNVRGSMGHSAGASSTFAKPLQRETFPALFGEAQLVTFIVGDIPQDVLVDLQVYPFSDLIPDAFKAKAGMLLAAASDAKEPVVHLDGIGSIRKIFDGSARLLRIFSFQ